MEGSNLNQYHLILKLKSHISGILPKSCDISTYLKSLLDEYAERIRYGFTSQGIKKMSNTYEEGLWCWEVKDLSSLSNECGIPKS